MNEVSEHYACIKDGFELETTKLALMDEVVRSCMELKSITDNFFDKFTQCVQQNNRSERLRGIIWQFVWFQNDNSCWCFKVWRPITKFEAYVSDIDNILQTCQVL